MSRHASSQTYNLPVKIIIKTPHILEDDVSKMSLNVDPSDCCVKARGTQTCHILLSPDAEELLEGSSNNLLKLNILDTNIEKLISSINTNDQMKLSQKTDDTKYVIIQIIQMNIIEKRFSSTKTLDSTSINEDIVASLLELEPCGEQPPLVNVERKQTTSKKEDFDPICIEPKPNKEQSTKDTVDAKSIKLQDAIETLIKNVMIAADNNVINSTPKEKNIDGIYAEPHPDNPKQDTTNNIAEQQIISQVSIKASDTDEIYITPIKNIDTVCIEAQPKKEEAITYADKTNQITIETLNKTTDSNDISNTPKKYINEIYTEPQLHKEQETTNNAEAMQIILQIKTLSKTVIKTPDTIEINMTPTNNFDASCIVAEPTKEETITDIVETKLITSHNSIETVTKIIMMAPDKNEMNITPTIENFNEVNIKPKSSYEQIKEAIYEIEHKMKEMPEHLLKNRTSYLQWDTLSLDEKKQLFQIEAAREIEELNKNMIKSEKKRLHELRRLNKVQAKLKKKLNEAENEVIRAKMMEGLTKLNRPHFKDTY